MKITKIFSVAVLAVFLASSAWAGNIPEFDAVGNDSTNVFAVYNLPYQLVVANNIGPNGPINLLSNFPTDWVGPKYTRSKEKFVQTAGQLFADPCYGAVGLVSALIDAYNEAWYEWYIVLQMKPESDINVNIYDCVLKHNEFNIWTGAEQTGRYRADWGQLFFVPSANPAMSVWAYPGEFATPGFEKPFIMDARLMPGLGLVSMEEQLYSSKAHWYEGILLAMPETGQTNVAGQTTYNLKQGDLIKVRVDVPFNNTCDIRYGKDNVLLKYIGIIGTWYYGVQ